MGIMSSLFGRKAAVEDGPRLTVIQGGDDGAKAHLDNDLSSFVAGALFQHAPELGNQEGLNAYATFTYVHACVRAKARNIARLPIKAYRRNIDGMTRELPDQHPLQQLLKRPNFYQTKFSFMETFCTYLGCTGEGFMMKDGPAFGGPGARNQLFLPRPDRVVIYPSREAYIEKYGYRVDGDERYYPFDRMLYHRYVHPLNDYRGLSPVEVIARSLKSQWNIENWNINYFANNARIESILTTEAELDEVQEKRFLNRFNSLFRGVANVGKSAIFSGGLKLQNMQHAPKDLDYPQQVRQNILFTLGVYGVQPVVVGLQDESIKANAKEQYRSFWEDTMVPETEMLADDMTVSLGQPFGDNIFIRFDLSGVEALKEAIGEKALRVKTIREAGIVTGNEAREEIGYERVPGGIWDQVAKPLGMGYVDPKEKAEDNPAALAPGSPGANGATPAKPKPDKKPDTQDTGGAQ